MHRARGIGLELLPQLEDVIVHGPSRRIVLVSPYFSQQLFTREDMLGAIKHEPENLELMRSQLDGLTIARGFHLGEVHVHVPKREYLGGGGESAIATAGSSPHASQKLARAERLRD